MDLGVAPRVIVAIAVILGFDVLYGLAVWQTLAQAEAPSFNDPTIWVGTALAGVVGAVVALGLGQRRHKKNLKTSIGSSEPGGTSRLHERVARFDLSPTRNVGQIIVPNTPADWQKALGLAYFLSYGALAFVSVVAMIARHPAPELVRTLAVTAIGVGLAATQGFFGIEDPDDGNP